MSHLSDEQLSMLVDGELSLGAREAAGRHLRDCVRCTERLDDLVEVAAELRLAPAVVWRPQATAAVLTRLEERPVREWSAPIAATLAVVGILLLALELPIIGAIVSVSTAVLAVLSAFLPAGNGLAGGAVVGVLLAFAVLGPLLAMPLSRNR